MIRVRFCGVIHHQMIIRENPFFHPVYLNKRALILGTFGSLSCRVTVKMTMLLVVSSRDYDLESYFRGRSILITIDSVGILIVPDN